jgi:DNA-binding transcriptional LysR family regulator
MRINVNLPDLEAVVAASEHGSFRAAAEILCISQSALGRRIEKIEATLGVRLFDRDTRNLALTVARREFVRKARHVLTEFEGALLSTQDIAQRLAREVTVACVPSAVGHFLPGVVKRYRDTYPNVRIQIRDEPSSEVLRAVTNGIADFGVTYIGTQEPDIQFQPLVEDPFVLICPCTHPLARKREVKWSELEGHDYIAIARSSGNRILMDLALFGTPLSLRQYCEVQHYSTLVQLVQARVGIGVVPRMGLPSATSKSFATVSLVEPTISRQLGLIKRRDRSLDVAAQQLYDLLVSSCSALV